jgi:hypothetical protein
VVVVTIGVVAELLGSSDGLHGWSDVGRGCGSVRCGVVCVLDIVDCGVVCGFGVVRVAGCGVGGEIVVVSIVAAV